MNLLRKLLGQGCTHRFSWPRVDEQGRHYQICLSCGMAFEYDWQQMKHTGRVLKATTDAKISPQGAFH